MKTVESVCRELKSLEGVVGAFVLQQNQCIGSSLPPQYDPNRLAQVGATLARVSQISQKAGYEQSAAAFHWQRASLLTWPIGNDGLLGLLAVPTAVRESVNLSAAIAIEDLSSIAKDKAGSGRLSVPAKAGHSQSPVLEQDNALLNARLGDIEQLLVEELGPSGKSLLDRSRTKTPRGTASATAWLLALRNTVLADIADPGARVTIATSLHWAELD
jgi:hypothetical protein